MQYSEKVIQHFKDPHNMGEIVDADAVGKVGNPVCGDLMHIYIKVEEKDGKEYLKDVKFKTFGCVAAIATSSMITDLAIGKTLDEALLLSNQDVSKALGNLPAIKEHCSNLAADGLHNAIENYKKGVKTMQNITCKRGRCFEEKENKFRENCEVDDIVCQTEADLLEKELGER